MSGHREGWGGQVPGARNGPQPRDKVEEQILLSETPGATYMRGIQVLGCWERAAGQQREVKVLGKAREKHDMDGAYGSLGKNLPGPPPHHFHMLGIFFWWL